MKKDGRQLGVPSVTIYVPRFMTIQPTPMTPAASVCCVVPSSGIDYELVAGALNAFLLGWMCEMRNNFSSESFRQTVIDLSYGNRLMPRGAVLCKERNTTRRSVAKFSNPSDLSITVPQDDVLHVSREDTKVLVF